MRWAIYWCLFVGLMLLLALYTTDGLRDLLPPVVFGVLNGIGIGLVAFVAMKFYEAITKRDKGD